MSKEKQSWQVLKAILMSFSLIKRQIQNASKKSRNRWQAICYTAREGATEEIMPTAEKNFDKIFKDAVLDHHKSLTESLAGTKSQPTKSAMLSIADILLRKPTEERLTIIRSCNGLVAICFFTKYTSNMVNVWDWALLSGRRGQPFEIMSRSSAIKLETLILP